MINVKNNSFLGTFGEGFRVFSYSFYSKFSFDFIFCLLVTVLSRINFVVMVHFNFKNIFLQIGSIMDQSFNVHWKI